jgi:hypothetical protein
MDLDSADIRRDVLRRIAQSEAITREPEADAETIGKAAAAISAFRATLEDITRREEAKRRAIADGAAGLERACARLIQHMKEDAAC